MCRIVFECMDRQGKLFSMSVESESDVIKEVVAEYVQANQRCGIEVISATRIEELPIDLSLHSAPAVQLSETPHAVKEHKCRFAWFVEKGAVMGALALGVVGFDNGFTLENVVAHIARLGPAAMPYIFPIV